MRCYYASNPSERGYRKRLFQLWLAMHPQSDISEQRLADQRSVITRNKLLTDVELEEIQRSARTQPTNAHQPAAVVVEAAEATTHSPARPQNFLRIDLLTPEQLDIQNRILILMQIPE